MVDNNKSIDLTEIAKQVTPEDKAEIATICDCSVAYINMVITGEREQNSERAQAIIKNLSLAAGLNEKKKAAFAKKATWPI